MLHGSVLFYFTLRCDAYIHLANASCRYAGILQTFTAAAAIIIINSSYLEFDISECLVNEDCSTEDFCDVTVRKCRPACLSDGEDHSI